MRIVCVKTVVAPALVALMLLLAPGGLSGGAGLELAEAQESTPESAPAAQVPDPPETNARSWVLIDARSGRYLAGENPDERLPMASTTKIMAALVALEDGADLDREVTISPEAAAYAMPPYSNAALYPYDRVSIGELIQGVLIPSGIDSVYALAEELGDGSVENFIGRMNEEASSLGLENTNFENPAGFDDPEQYSSARDLATNARAGLQYPFFAETVDSAEVTISTQNRNIELVNTNSLLQTYPPATGVKTGTSPQAGALLISSAEAGDESYIAVVMDAEDRFAASEALLEYAFGRYENSSLVSEDEVYGELTLPYRRGESVELVATEDLTGAVDATSEVERRVTTQEAPPSAEAGQELGEVEVLIDGESIGQSPLVAQEGYEEASVWDRIQYAAGSLLAGAREFLGGIIG